MLSKFAVTNYRGFAQRIELDLSNPGKYDFNAHAIKNGVVKSAIVYGSNGSGKSNLGFAVFDIVHHLTLKNKQNDYGKNFTFAGCKGEPAKFEYYFIFNSQVVVYTYSKNSSAQLVEESLSVDGEMWFHRNGGLELNEALFPVSNEMKEKWKNPANNTSFVSFLLGTFPFEENSVLVKMQNFVDSMLFFRNLEERSYIGFDVGNAAIEKFIIENNLVQDFSKFLKDVSGQCFDFATPSAGDEILQCNVNGASIPFSYVRSTGT
ncbi:MAG: ATP-binding protein, partial [Fibrobacter sp.]|nr:ATP-binding protein [Fibrobacter sp.]